MDKRKAVKRMLSNLSTSNFAEFRHELVHRKKEPLGRAQQGGGEKLLRDHRVKDAGVEYSEPGSRNMGATGGPASENGSRDSEHFVDKHRTELVNRVNCVADILDQLLAKKVITQSIYDEILVIPTSQKQMRELFSGPLKSAGPRGKDVFYGILEKEEKYLIDDLKGKK
ncbi:hypothetical protein KUCAC02_014350 [Chaenocephalus aceratus]|uniref:Uncharacterized protein n=1 Tax=Chaenocephalus aceratus TaxID=36190 RepID=A0ACB9WEE0_CHAAC|nr:hypothetical protein KUCAC02_014350 [Chaenocephalus aceratus]